jgi:hypothetical protein
MEYAISEIIGSGTIDQPYRPVVADYGCDYVAVEKDGIFFVKFENCIVSGVLLDDRLTTLNKPLTDTINATTANVVNNRLDSKYGITSDPVVAGMTVQQALEAILVTIDDSADFSKIKLGGNS